MMLIDEFLGMECMTEITEDSVLIEFGAFDGLDEIHSLDMRLFKEIPLEIGRHDGHEVAFDDTHGTLFSYGKNAEKLFKRMRPILENFHFLDGATVHLTFRNEGKKTTEIEFDFHITGN